MVTACVLLVGSVGVVGIVGGVWWAFCRSGMGTLVGVNMIRNGWELVATAFGLNK